LLKVEISNRGLIFIALAIFAVWLTRELWPVILLITVSLVFMVGLLPFAEALHRRGLPRTAAVLALMLALLAVFIATLSLMLPAMIDEFESIRDDLPSSARELEELLAMIGIHVELQERASNIDWNRLVSGRAAINWGQRVLTTTVSIITVMVMTAYFLIDTPRLSRFVNLFIPADRKGDADYMFRSFSRVMGGYLRGQAVTSLAIGVYTFFVLQIIGVPNALAFAVLAAIADIVPIIGALIAVLPPAAAALPHSSTQAGVVLITLMAYQQFEDRFLVPRVYGQTLNLPPIIVLIAVLAGAELLGIIGVLLALPFAAAARVGIDFFIEHRHFPLVQPPPEPAKPQPPDEPLAHAADLNAPDRMSANGSDLREGTRVSEEA